MSRERINILFHRTIQSSCSIQMLSFLPQLNVIKVLLICTRVHWSPLESPEQETHKHPSLPYPHCKPKRLMAIGSLKCYLVLVWEDLCGLLLCNSHKIYHCVWKINDYKFSCTIFWQSRSDCASRSALFWLSKKKHSFALSVFVIYIME